MEKIQEHLLNIVSNIPDKCWTSIKHRNETFQIALISIHIAEALGIEFLLAVNIDGTIAGLAINYMRTGVAMFGPPESLDNLPIEFNLETFVYNTVMFSESIRVINLFPNHNKSDAVEITTNPLKLTKPIIIN